MKKEIDFLSDAMEITVKATKAADKVVLNEINKFEDCNIAFQAQVYQMISEMFFAMCQVTAKPLELSEDMLKNQKEQFFNNSKKFESGMEGELIKVKKEIKE